LKIESVGWSIRRTQTQVLLEEPDKAALRVLHVFVVVDDLRLDVLSLQPTGVVIREILSIDDMRAVGSLHELNLARRST
jgi:hypothetical protein